MAKKKLIPTYEEIRSLVKSGMMDKAAEAHNQRDFETRDYILESMKKLDAEVEAYQKQKYVDGAIASMEAEQEGSGNEGS